MLEENRDKLIDLVGEAAELPPSERRAFIRATAAGPAEQDEALSLLDALEHAGDFMDRPSGAHPALPADWAGDAAGRIVGRYRLLDLIGEGGFGHVFLAEQQEPVVRRVALKIVRPGMDTQGVIARFEAERQALAMMDHPAIAKVFDGGATESGRPYFVMELVDGLPITAYCDRTRMTVADRLHLFREVCDAVQHAHQKGVIHRDLKPANVLVAEHDGRARPKVIDFGIAKAVTHAPANGATRLQEFIGTPEYMSPEQTLGPGADIDTRSDIYSLGVILYELLTGATPLDAGTLRSAGPAEMQRLIRDTVAPRPSTMLAGAPAADIAAQRRTDPQHLRMRLREDLDWIVLRALEKDRDRRYPTAAALSDDIRRSLDHEPVTASPPSALYRLRKFVRRHRTATVAGSLAAASLLLGAVAASAGLIASNKQRHRAEEVKAFMTSMLEAATPTVARGEDTTLVRKVLDRAAARLNAGEVPDPLIDAELRQTIGSTYDQIGEEPAAEAMLNRAIELRTAALGPEHPQTLDSIATLGNIYRHMGRRPEAEAILRKAHAGLQRRLGDRHRDTLETLNDLGVALEGLGRFPEAQKCFAEALAGLTTIAGRDDALTINAEYNLGFVFLSMGKYAEAEPYLTRVLGVRRRTLGDDDPLTLATMSAVAGLKLELGRMDEAESLLQVAVPTSRRIFGDDSSHTVAVISSMGRLLVETGRAQAGEALLREAYDHSRQRVGPDHPDTLSAQANLAMPLSALGRMKEAEAVSREALEGMRRSKALGPMHPRTLYKAANFAALLRDMGKLEEAEAEARRACDGLKQVLAPDHPSTLAAIHTLGTVLRSRNQAAQAEPLLREAMTGRTTVLGPKHPRTLVSVAEHAGSLADLGRFTEAEQELLASIRAAAPTSAGTTPPPAVLSKALTALYEAWDRAEPSAGHDVQAPSGGAAQRPHNRSRRRVSHRSPRSPPAQPRGGATTPPPTAPTAGYPPLPGARAPRDSHPSGPDSLRGSRRDGARITGARRRAPAAEGATMNPRLAAIVLGLSAAASTASAQTAFTYQGQLKVAGAPANGTYDLRFRLFDAQTGGTQLGPTVCADNTAVSAGLLTIPIDFGAQFAASSNRFLEIEARADTGLDCTNAAGFVTLSPRQEVTAAPLATHALTSFALSAPDGSPANAVFVDNAGRVGIGTTTPGKTLTVNGDMEIGLSSGNYQHLRIGGGNSDGFLYGSFVHFADGIHLGYNYYADAAGVNHVINSGGGTSRLSMQYGAVVFATAPVSSSEPLERARIDSAGSLGIGTPFPGSKLDVRGDIRLGASGQYLAPGAQENLRIIRGNISNAGVITAGGGFSIQHVSCGEYVLTFDTPFNGPPTITTSVTAGTLCAYSANVESLTNGSARIYTRRDCDAACIGFNFIAIGPR